MGTLSSTMTKPTGIERATGRDREQWFKLLDRWGAAGRPYSEIAAWLTGKHGLSNWWAQKLIVEYEQARGVREAGARPDGTFSGGASKTVNVPVERLYRAFTDSRERKRWLPEAQMRVRTSQEHRSARFDWEDGTRVSAMFLGKGKAKSEVGVQHELLPSTRAAEKMKAFWRERLVELKDQLES